MDQKGSYPSPPLFTFLHNKRITKQHNRLIIQRHDKLVLQQHYKRETKQSGHTSRKISPIA